ncbi:hypothetical protein EVAR_58732_1 [Eumeta japonica]|uniref:Uncharacterized protein n=1 Tax=Eumeta variegata TaxID=151549 RepID=A0A4C1YW74_EUMVA|nr:hypothetical protein EVAR_58732_1 [Eumeta japonica]
MSVNIKLSTLGQYELGRQMSGVTNSMTTSRTNGLMCSLRHGWVANLSEPAVAPGVERFLSEHERVSESEVIAKFKDERHRRTSFAKALCALKQLMCCARGRPIIVEWERDARHSAGLSLVRSSPPPFHVFHAYTSERFVTQKSWRSQRPLASNLERSALQFCKSDSIPC